MDEFDIFDDVDEPPMKRQASSWSSILPCLHDSSKTDVSNEIEKAVLGTTCSFFLYSVLF